MSVSQHESYSRLLSAESDRPAPSGSIARLLICTTPRTAGHTFCRALSAVNWGVPTEYFHPGYALPLMNRWTGSKARRVAFYTQQAAHYGRLLLANRVANGIFSAKVFFEQLDFLRQCMGDDLENWFCIRLFRRDKTAQTISLATMSLTRRPFDGPVKDYSIHHAERLELPEIENFARYLMSQEALWDEFCRRLDPGRIVRVACEDFLDSPANAISRIAGQFSLPGIGEASFPGWAPYRIDRAVKDSTQERFGKQIADLWRAFDNSPTRTPGPVE
jgi:LPS sulfotransferase NodH